MIPTITKPAFVGNRLFEYGEEVGIVNQVCTNAQTMERVYYTRGGTRVIQSELEHSRVTIGKRSVVRELRYPV